MLNRSSSAPRINVIGAGVVGLCVAVELAERHCRVTLVDVHPEPGPHACSWWAGGMLAPWCESESAPEPVLRLGQQALSWWQAKTGQVHYQGSLVIAPERDHRDLLRFAQLTAEYQHLDQQAIGTLEPDLKDRFTSALFFPKEAHLSPRAVLQTLHQRLAGQGVIVQAQAPEADITIDCRGLAARDTLTDQRGVKGEMLILRCPDLNFKRPIRLLHPRIPLYLVPRGDHVFMLGATMIESDERSRISARSMLEMLSSAYALHPAFAEAQILEIGVDVRPAFPDNLPRIRRIGDRIYVNGLYRHGFLLSPALACMSADYVLNGIIPEFFDEHSM